MKILLDTNIVVDIITGRLKDSKMAYEKALDNEVEFFITANSATDIFYHTYQDYKKSQEFPKSEALEKARADLDSFLDYLEVLPVTREDIESSFNHPAILDIEDAMVDFIAAKNEMDYIITHDKDFLKAVTEVRTLSPEQFLEVIEQE